MSPVQKNITQLGPREAEFLMNVASKGNGHFTIETAMEFWSSAHVAHNKLTQLVKKGWISRIERGKYVVIPLEAGPLRQWAQDEYIVAQILVQPSAIAYWSAIRHWNWTEQIPRVVYVQTAKRKKKRQEQFLGVTYRFVMVPPHKFFGNVKEWREGSQVFVTDKEKTLIDCANDVERAGGIQELIKAVRESAHEISWERLTEYAAKFNNGAVLKRLGFLFEKFTGDLELTAKNTLEQWQGSLTQGVVPLNPSLPKAGTISTRWKILNNAGIK